MEYDDSFESDDDDAGEKQVADAAPANAAASPGQTHQLLDADEYGSDTFEQASSVDEYADESFDPPPSPKHEPSPSFSPVVAQSSAAPCTDTPKGVDADFPVETSMCETTPTIEDSRPTWMKLDAQAFVTTKLQKLSTQRRFDEDVPPSLSVRVPVSLLHTLQRPASHVADGSRPRRRQRSTTSTMTVPAGMVDRVRIQTLFSTMQHEASSAAPSRPDVKSQAQPRSLFAFTARHHSRLHDRLWAMQIDALEDQQLQYHDTLGWIADHMRRHREVYEPV